MKRIRTSQLITEKYIFQSRQIGCIKNDSVKCSLMFNSLIIILLRSILVSNKINQ